MPQENREAMQPASPKVEKRFEGKSCQELFFKSETHKTNRKHMSEEGRKMAKNENMNKARKAKFDEFYTQRKDIEKEMRHYKGEFKGKVVLCNCDDPWESNFFLHFSHNFHEYGLKKLITTCYQSKDWELFSKNDSKEAVYLEYYGHKKGNRVPTPEELDVKPLKGDGDFSGSECVELMKQADIVVTNPPFSLIRNYIALLIKHEKSFIIIGNELVKSYKEVFPLFVEKKMWVGCETGAHKFRVPDSYNGVVEIDKSGNKFISMGNIVWYTNIAIPRLHEDLMIESNYYGNEEEYPKYDNYDAINVNKVKKIPRDYYDVMGVPTTFLNRHNPDQFEIIGNEYMLNISNGRGYVKGERKSFRMFIKRIK